jgi:predicted RNase H-like nuclease
MSAAAAGVDGCRGGWICVLKDMAPPYREHAMLASCFEDVLNHADETAIIAIDIPCPNAFREAAANAMQPSASCSASDSLKGDNRYSMTLRCPS